MKKEMNDEKWKEKLTPQQYHVCREGGTEMPFTGKLLTNKEKGTYLCVACKNPLFSADTKFESGTGWPSFYDVLSKGNVTLKEDNSLFMKRTEVLCANCGSHLGHRFNDGPNPTGQRYCINSVSLDFEKDKGAAKAGKKA